MKKKCLRSFLLAIVMLSFSAEVHSQNNEDVIVKTLPSKNIEGKLNNLMDKASNFQEYKVIKKDLLFDFQNSFSSFINNAQNKYSSLYSNLEDKESTIHDLNKELDSVKLQNAELSTAVDSVSLFGLHLNKGTYNLLMWSFVIGFGIVTAFFIFRFKRANEITKNAKDVLAGVEDEYQVFKQNAIEREQKLRRQLQDEIKKTRKLKEAS